MITLSQKYFASLGLARKAQVQRDSRIGVAIAQMETKIAVDIF